MYEGLANSRNRLSKRVVALQRKANNLASQVRIRSACQLFHISRIFDHCAPLRLPCMTLASQGLFGTGRDSTLRLAHGLRSQRVRHRCYA